MSREIDKKAGREAVAAYIDEHGPDVPMSDLRSYVRARSGIDFGGPTLATFLRSVGYVRDGVRKIDTSPGQTVFYVRTPAL
ncbi:hypothetical protein [Sphingomonas bacterium]|uniref:hypothetical protein n=1 Tax=Sphingomonas bacterium TaxID=1895847 RepID=UPI001577185D|nr:hypothetical protein [Sphingomonas bacterium]